MERFGEMRDRLTTRTAELSASEERTRAIIDTAFDAVVTMDAEGRISGWNSQAEAMFGWPRDAAIGARLSALIIPSQYREAHQRGLSHFLSTGEGPVLNRRIEVSALRRDGKEFPVEFAVTAYQRNGTYAFSAFIRDLTERKQADATRSHLATLVESSDDAIIGMGLDGVINSWNRGAERLYGYAFDEVIGRSIAIVVPANRPDEVPAILERIRSGQTVERLDTVRQRKDGTLVDVAITISPVADMLGQVIGAATIARDITAQRLAEEERSRMLTAERGARAAAEAARERQTLLAEASVLLGETLEYETTLRRVAGLAVPRLADWCTVDLLVENEIRRVAAVHVDSTQESMLGEADGRNAIHIRESRGAAIAIRSSQPLVQSELSAADLEDVARDVGPRGIPQQLNPCSRLIVPLVLRSRSFGALSLLYGESRRHYTSADLPLAEEIARRAAMAIENSQLYRQAHDAAEAASAAEAATRESNRHLEQALSDLKKAQTQIIQQERLRALGQMASGIAHDFNNALMLITGYTELALMRPDILENAEKMRSYLEIIDLGARDASQVVTRLREFYRSRETSEPLVSVDLVALIQQVVSLTQPHWRDQAMARGATIRVETEFRELPPVSGSEPELRELLTNLIFNAVDAMPNGGLLAIRARRDDGQVTMDVADTGIGMSEEVRLRCLEPFFTTKGDRGTGIGLAMAYGIIQRHQGTLAIESELGRGTTITIGIPLHCQAPAPTEGPALSDNRPLPLRILVVEDEALLRGLYIDYLQGSGHQVVVAANGRDGLVEFLRHEEAAQTLGRFDLVLTDRALPELNGDQLAVAIKRVVPGIPIILLTGFGDLMNAAGEIPSGIDAILGKPVQFPQLAQTIARLTNVN